VSALGSNTVLDTLSPLITTLREHSEQSDSPEAKTKFTTLTSGVIAGIISAEPKSYRESLDGLIQKGQFGEPREVLPRVLDAALNEGMGMGEFGGRATHTIARMLDRVVQFEDPALIEPLKNNLPFFWLDGKYEEDELRQLFPRVHQMLEQPLMHGLERYDAIARMFLEGNENQVEAMVERVKKGDFGDSFETFGKVLAVVSLMEEKHWIQLNVNFGLTLLKSIDMTQDLDH
jgi:hypothetical protein